MLVFTGVTISFFVQSHNFTFGGFSSERLGLVLLLLMSAIGGILLTALLHGDFIAVLCSGLQYWCVRPQLLAPPAEETRKQPTDRPTQSNRQSLTDARRNKKQPP